MNPGRTLVEDLRRAATISPDAEAVITPTARMTFAELDLAADEMASALVADGLQRGSRVALILQGGVDAVVAIYGVWRAGGVVCPINPAVKQAKLHGLLAHSGATAAIGEPSAAVVEATRAGGVRLYGELPRGMASASLPPPLTVDLAALVYTSGSTGEPKGVTLSHANMAFVADSIIEYLQMDSSERVLSVLPLSFGYGLYQLLTTVRCGATLLLEPGFRYPGRLVERMIEERATALPAVPTIFTMLESMPTVRERDFPDLRVLTNAGAALPEVTVRALRELFPDARLYLMYGLTECQRVCFLPPEEVDRRPTSVGRAIPGTDAWVETEAGERAAAGEVGELVVRGAHVMQGYWRDPERTARRLRAGVSPSDRILLSGDLFRADEDGYLYFVSRRDDVIKSRGQKVAPKEVEDALLAHAGVLEAAVVGVPDRLLGEAVHAHVAPRPGAELDERELKRHCANLLEDHMVPSAVVIHDELPRTANSKLDRQALRAAATVSERTA